MKLTEALLGEHGVLSDLLDQLDEVARNATSAGAIHAALELPARALLHHATIEDEHLFPALEAVIGKAGPTSVMRHEHAAIEDLVGRVSDAEDLEICRRTLVELLATTRAHFRKEELALFPIALRALGPDRLSAMCVDWASNRRVAVEGDVSLVRC